MVNVFAVSVFFIVFRETLETGIIVSVLLAFIKKSLNPDRDAGIRKSLVRQIWLGTGIGLAICLVIGAALIGTFYGLKSDKWSGTENIWEGTFALVASMIITLMGAALLRVSKLREKWTVKLGKSLDAKDNTERLASTGRFKRWCEKYAMFMLPFITVLREGLEAIIFIGGVTLGLPATSFPIPVLTGVLCGVLVSYFIYKGGSATSIQLFLIISTCFLYLVAAGLFSKSVGLFEMDKWNKIIGGDAAETGVGPGSYDIRKSVWHVNCCSPQINGGGGWGIFNAIFGWQNSATYGTVISYNMYWIAVIAGFVLLRYKEKTGHWPLMKAKARSERQGSDSTSEEAGVVPLPRVPDDKKMEISVSNASS